MHCSTARHNMFRLCQCQWYSLPCRCLHGERYPPPGWACWPGMPGDADLVAQLQSLRRNLVCAHQQEEERTQASAAAAAEARTRPPPAPLNARERLAQQAAREQVCAQHDSPPRARALHGYPPCTFCDLHTASFQRVRHFTRPYRLSLEHMYISMSLVKHEAWGVGRDNAGWPTRT